MDPIIIKIAIESDLDSISKFIKTNFEVMEPVMQSYQLKTTATNDSRSEIDKVLNEFHLECIKSQTAFVAYTLENELVGVLLSNKIEPKHCEETLELTSDGRFEDFCKLMAYVGSKADVFKRLNVQHSLHIEIISVHKDYVGRGIASKLFEECLKQAKALNFPALSLDCTSYFTSKICEKNNLELLSTVSYDEFNSHAGELLFIPNEPHTLIKSYGIVFYRDRNYLFLYSHM